MKNTRPTATSAFFSRYQLLAVLLLALAPSLAARAELCLDLVVHGTVSSVGGRNRTSVPGIEVGDRFSARTHILSERFELAVFGPFGARFAAREQPVLVFEFESGRRHAEMIQAVRLDNDTDEDRFEILRDGTTDFVTLRATDPTDFMLASHPQLYANFDSNISMIRQAQDDLEVSCQFFVPDVHGQDVPVGLTGVTVRVETGSCPEPEDRCAHLEFGGTVEGIYDLNGLPASLPGLEVDQPFSATMAISQDSLFSSSVGTGDRVAFNSSSESHTIRFDLAPGLTREFELESLRAADLAGHDEWQVVAAGGGLSLRGIDRSNEALSFLSPLPRSLDTLLRLIHGGGDRFVFESSSIRIDTQGGPRVIHLDGISFTAEVGLCDSFGSSAFLRGDGNGNGGLDISDGIATLGYLFNGSVQLACESAADVNDDGTVALSDAINVFQYLFLDGAPPQAPFPICDQDPTADSLTCEAPACS